jgi:hypothetical protein
MGRQAGDVKVLGEIGNATPARLHHRPLTHRFLHPPDDRSREMWRHAPGPLQTPCLRKHIQPS